MIYFNCGYVTVVYFRTLMNKKKYEKLIKKKQYFNICSTYCKKITNLFEYLTQCLLSN